MGGTRVSADAGTLAGPSGPAGPTGTTGTTGLTVLTGLTGPARKAGVVMLVALALAGCGDGTPRLLNLTATGAGPDEFAVLPTSPLVVPGDLTALPPPTPGARNLADPNPKGDVAVALGGQRDAVDGGGVRDPALIAHTGRFGTEAGIRSDLAAADLAYRQRRPGRPLERLFNVNTYYRAYRRQELDQYRALDRYRAAGVQTAAAPPDPAIR